MKTLSRYVLFELLKVFAVTLTGMTLFFIVLGVVKEAYTQGLGLKQVLLLIPFALPEALLFAVPGTLLFAACSVYGRMAAFNEVTAVKSAGISPMVLFWPTFVLAVLLSLGTVWLNDLAVSWGRSGMRRVVIESVEEIAYARLAQQRSFATRNFAINVKAIEGKRLIGPTFTFQANLDTPAYTVTAEAAELRADVENDTLTVIFHEADLEANSTKARFPYIERELPLSEATRKGRGAGSPSDLPLHRIPEEIELSEQNIAVWQQENAALAGFQLISGDFESLGTATWQPLTQRIQDGRQRIARLKMEPQRRWANGFSCLCFVMVGAPLAVRLRNVHIMTSFFMCFAPILLVYFPLLIFSVDRAKAGGIPPVSVWLGNVLMAIWGWWILRRVIRY
jgi:lipopolysaccharide export system permease protein